MAEWITCEKCGFHAYGAEVDRHIENVPESCVSYLRTKATTAEAKQEAYKSMLESMEEKFVKAFTELGVKQSQLLSPKNAKELETFVKEPRGY